MAKPAVPATFHLQMRLVSPNGRHYPDASYRIKWGKHFTPVAKTDAYGMVDEDLDALAQPEFIELGDGDDDASFVPRLRIPLWTFQRPPPYKPASQIPTSNTRGRTLLKKKPPREPDPLPPPPPTSPPAPRPDPRLIAIPPAKREDGPAPVPETASPPAAQADLLDAQEKVVKASRDRLSAMCDLAWRLHNLGFLVLKTRLSFPFQDDIYAELEDALKRYMYRYMPGRTPLTAIDFVSVDPGGPLAEVLADVKKRHDDPTS